MTRSPSSAVLGTSCRSLAGRYSRVIYVDSSGPMLTSTGSINGYLMPDAQFPSVAGYEALLTQKWMPAIEGIVGSTAGS